MKALHPDAKPSKIRYQVLFLIFVNVVINYMDRSNLAVAASEIDKEFGLTPVQLGLVFSAFSWTYLVFQIPGGILVNRFSPHILYAICLIGWSLATVMQGFAKGFASLFGLRMTTGMFEAPAFSINNRVVSNWFPDNERASAIAVYTSGQFLGLAFLMPVLSMIQLEVGWRGLFVVTGLIGTVWGIIWYLLYRDPLKHKAVNAAELQHIERGGGLLDKQQAEKKTAFRWKDLKIVLSYRKLWGIYIGQFAVNSTLWFFLTWFPKYLADYRGLNFIKSGYWVSVPYVAAFTGILCSGFLSDYLVKKGVSAAKARKLPIIIGLLLSAFILGANYVNMPGLIIFFMSLSFFGVGFASITWIFVSTLAPKHLINLTGGVFNFIGQLAGIIVPIVIGFLASGGSFAPALVFVAVLGLLGACSYIFLVGNVERIKIEEENE
ncbi:MFS transporter [Chitinophaga ginsengisegetis]|uniref:MFS transporter n=1 Tax=Chitinophaga ginsengisegetis TaxID=393003 RepID=UPI000DB90036|nr:MFS transporter [Chitinophaga ginsengisegetis]MDR6570666.1 ACS family D-galactonate transporter-like MFS transporter [Chitinophaga ginsengisegetis]MDR6650400.1 ACS family D-galactonate transporter-like MFS transporter [Chitinophaga ginsengisegetis]MDR6656961.1 ACS family D-galactonate transporter-like MFS transporter [Chitinophaga ginsengisegetis]